MGGKKAGGAKKSSGPADDPEALQKMVNEFSKAYKKRCTEMEIKPSAIIRNALAEFADDEDKVPKKFHFWEELGWPGVKALIEALKQAK